LVICLFDKEKVKNHLKTIKIKVTKINKKIEKF
jgi:hypothetical protein